MSDKDIPKLASNEPAISARPPFKPQPRKLSEAEIALTESMQPFYTVTPPAGTTRDDMLRPIFWSHVARRLRPMSEIRVCPRDGAWYGVYLVIYSDEHQAKLHELLYTTLDTLSERDVDADPYIVQWISPPVKWGIRRRSDKEIVKDGFQTKDQATAWKNQNLSTLGNPNKAA